MGELKNLGLRELFAIYRHVTQHKDQAIILSDKLAEDNATWLLAEVKREIKEKA